jgi:hypothetical protein
MVGMKPWNIEWNLLQIIIDINFNVFKQISNNLRRVSYN